MLDSFHFHHIGYVVYNNECTAAYFLMANWQISNIQTDVIQNEKNSISCRRKK
jgi:hypothetical protein